MDGEQQDGERRIQGWEGRPREERYSMRNKDGWRWREGGRGERRERETEKCK